jgi:Zn-dependent peptidase ImmA (M78 family)
MPKVNLNIYLTAGQHAQMARMRATGINMSAIARLAIKKFASCTLEPDDDTPKAKRVVLYISADDAETLSTLSAREGVSRSSVLRRLISIYLRANAAAIKSLF